MALKIRLRQQGRKNALCYRLVVTDSRNPRDGKYVESLGYYQPQQNEDRIVQINSERLQHWLSVGAQLTEKANALVKKNSPEVYSWYTKRLEDKKLAQKAKAKAKKKA